MPPQIRIDLEKRLSERPVAVELGCGRNKPAERIGIDRVDLPTADIVASLEDGLPYLPDNSVDALYAHSVLEHVRNFDGLMAEIVRVLRPDGRAHVYVPHFSNPYQFSDYTHVRPFGFYTFAYFMETRRQYRRKVPNFYNGTRIRMLSQTLVFESPFFLSRLIKRAFGFVVNRGSILQELYEAHFCYLFPCQGIYVVFAPDKEH